MVLLLGFDQHVAQGTSLLVIIPAAVAGSWTHHRKGRLHLRDAAAVAAGGIVGAAAGAIFALGIEDDLLRRLFAVRRSGVAAARGDLLVLEVVGSGVAAHSASS